MFTFKKIPIIVEYSNNQLLQAILNDSRAFSRNIGESCNVVINHLGSIYLSESPTKLEYVLASTDNCTEDWAWQSGSIERLANYIDIFQCDRKKVVNWSINHLVSNALGDITSQEWYDDSMHTCISQLDGNYIIPVYYAI